MRTITMADWKVNRKQKKLIKEVLKSGRLTYGEKTAELERRFAELHGKKYGIMTSSGTAALKISIGALKERYKWQDGDEVLIPSVTFVATMNAVLMNNLKPVLVDVDISDVTMDPDLIEKHITNRTRAIIPVHLLGQPAHMGAIKYIAKTHKLKIIEDSCETMFVGQPVGSMGDVSCFSTYVAHLLVTGIGGFILTDDEKLATTMRSMLFHGRDEAYLNIDDNQKDPAELVAKRFHFPRFGYSDRVTELEAALGLGSIDEHQKMIETRQEYAKYLYTNLWETFKVTFPIRDFYNHAFMFFPIYAERRDELMLFLEKRGIQTRTMMPLTTQPIVRKHIRGNLKARYPVANHVNTYGMLIGCHQYMNVKDLDYIIDTIKEFYNA